MSRKRQRADKFEHLAAETGGEDGTDARTFHAKPWDAPRQASRKGRQLCAQVKDSLHVALGSCADELLHQLCIVSVEPAPNTGRLRVLLEAGDVDRAAVQASLSRAANHLRAEVAQAICRRYTPELVFEVV